jgi:S-DNA-T family DNA segregation ATPase FtsK/SpoIIIE
MTTMTAPRTDAASQGETIVARLTDLGAPCRLLEIVEGPQVRRFLLEPTGPKTRMVDFTRLKRAEDLAFELGVAEVTITAPASGLRAVAVDVARENREMVSLSDLPGGSYPLLVPIGVEVDGRPAILPLADAPHVLCAGQTGSGKSSVLHVILAQLCASHSPDQLGLVLIDPKRTEMARWADDPHMIAPIADTPESSVSLLAALCSVMDARYEKLQRMGARDVRQANEMRRGETGEADAFPYVVCVVDELAELMMMSGKDAETHITRLAQKGRACGIHLILATQYPMSSVLTGLIRVNVPTKLALTVPDATASRLVLGQNGADKLTGRGDALISITGAPPVRMQSAFVTEADCESVKAIWR